jgi:hypothetical protein
MPTSSEASTAASSELKRFCSYCSTWRPAKEMQKGGQGRPLICSHCVERRKKLVPQARAAARAAVAALRENRATLRRSPESEKEKEKPKR